MMKTFIKLIYFFCLLLLVALPVYAQSTGNVELSLSPATGPIYITNGTDIQIILKPQGRDIVAVDFGLSYVGSDLVLSDGGSNTSYDYIKTGNEGDWRITYTRQFGKPMPASDQEGKVILGTVHLTPSASKQSGSVLVRVIAPPGYSAPKITLLDKSQVADALVTAGSGTYDIGAVPATPTPTSTPTPTPTPTPLPENPAITAPFSGANFTISSDPNSNRPEFRWNMMSSPAGGRVKQMGVRVIRASLDPNSAVGSLPMDCSGQVMIDQWWFSQASADGQSRNSIRTCSDIGGTSVSSEANSSDLVAQSLDFSGKTNFTFRPTGQLSPGKYFVTVFNFDTTYRGDSDTTVNGVDTSPNNNFTSNHFFKVSCPASAPVWDPNSKSCRGTQVVQYAISENPDDLKDDATITAKNLWKPYDGQAITYKFDSTFRPLQLGQTRTIFVRFKGEVVNGQAQVSPPFVDNRNNKVSPLSRGIKYIGPDPTITNISCGFNSDTGTGSKVIVTGDNFGDAQGRGKIAITGQSEGDLKISSWGRVVAQPASGSPTATPSATPTATPSATLSPSPTVTNALPTQGRVVVKVKNKLDGAVNVTLTTDDGRQIIRSCSVDTNTVTFTAQTQCRQPGSSASDGVRVQVYESVAGARPIFDTLSKPISLDSAGLPQWTPPSLEVGKTYKMVIKAARTLAVKKEFTVLEGTNDANNGDPITLPVGDIAPLSAPDGVVNALDKSELIREWSATTDTARAGDFNGDGRINSLDYACMRQNINRSGDQFIK